MIGLALITFVAVIGQGFKTSFTGAVNEQFIADYSVSAGATADLLTSKAAKAVAKAPGVEAVSEIRSGDATVGGTTVLVTGVDGDLTKVDRRPWSSGSERLPAQLGSDGAFVVKRYADDHSLTLGSPLTLKTSAGKSLRLHVTGISTRPRAARRSARSRSRQRRSTAPSPITATTSPCSTSAAGRASEHRAARAEPHGVPIGGRRDARRVQGQPHRPVDQALRCSTHCSACR